MSKLSEEEQWRVEHELHVGHDSMHVGMMLVLLLTLVLTQLTLIVWRKWHSRSYERVTLAVMWIVPPLVSVRYDYWRFVVVWTLFSSLNGFVCYRASRRPLSSTTPRLVYKWFLLVYKTSYALGLAGFSLTLLTLFGLTVLLMIKQQTSMDLGLLLLFYGLYLGVVARDFAEVCSETMAARFGYYSQSGLVSRSLAPDVCAVCGNQIMIIDNAAALFEKTFKLSCDHLFHEFCVRGWCIVGKKQTCPYCRERVDLQRLFPSPWDRPHLLYGSLLDWVRFLVAWQPIVFIIAQAVNTYIGLD